MKKSLLILCLLIGVANAKFIRDDSKEVVLDTQTNLVWQDDAHTSTQPMSWSDAISYCEALNLGNYSNWHLPNFNELYYLVNKEKFNPALDSGFSYVATSFYWSATTYANGISNAWGVNFNYGNDDSNDKGDSNYVRCVRDRQ